MTVADRSDALREFDAVRACPVCGGADRARAVFVLQDLLHGVPGEFSYDRCRDCRSTYQSPRVAEDRLAECYPADYFTHAPVADPVARTGRGHRFRQVVLEGARASRADGVGRGVRVLSVAARRIPAIRRRVQMGVPDALDAVRSYGRYLEIGPGTGMDMWRMAELGWQVEGLDIDPAAAVLAEARSGCPVHAGPLSSFAPPHGFDLVYSSHSLEHLPDLRRALRDIAALLNPQGRIVVIVPNPASLVARVFGGAAPAWDPPRHLVLAPPCALAAAMTTAGFRRVRVSTTARRAPHHAAIARARRRGAVGSNAWSATPGAGDRLVAFAEWALIRAGRRVGEEILATGEWGGP